MSYTNITNITGMTGILEYANTATNGIFGIGVLIGLYLIILLQLKRTGDEFTDAMTAAGFVTSIAATFMLLMGLINSTYLFIVILLMVLPTLWSYYNKS